MMVVKHRNGSVTLNKAVFTRWDTVMVARKQQEMKYDMETSIINHTASVQNEAL